jgi:hypothetical protein
MMMQICPDCKNNNTEYLETREGKKYKSHHGTELSTEIDFYYCWDCDYLWKMEDGNFIAGAIVRGGQQDFPSFDDMEITIVESLNLKDLEYACIFCGDVALRNADTNTYECPKCGGSWEVV